MRRLNARKAGTKNNKHKMDAVKLPQRPAPRSTSFFSRSSRQPKPNLCILFFILIALALVVSCGFLLPDKLSISSRRKFSIVIDGGSTGTRIHVFTYRIEHGSNAIFDFGAIGLASMRVNPGLSAYAENVDGAGNSLVELFEFAKRRVPREFWGETEIRLMATAGLRMLELEIQDRILVSCRRALRESGFVFLDDWASVITGSDEGVYAWVVANYALGTLGGDPHHTTGIIELGGASAQVTFSSSESIPPEFSRTVKFGNITYNLYSHSFLHFGQIAAFESMRDLLISEDNISAGKSLQTGFVDPCTPNGYSHIETSKLSPGSMDEKERHMSSFSSGGNFSECRSAALKLLQKEKDKCAYRQCYIGSTFTPKLQGKFLATENFYYTSKFFGLTQKAVLSDVVLAGEEFCREDWSVLKKRHHSINEEDLLRYCFSSAYIVALLHDSFGIALNDERVQFANQVESIPLDWALGAFILQSTVALDAEKKPNWVMSILSNDSSTLFSLAAIFMIFAFISWTVSKWLKPQLKTIYDLEKGRYIVTRVNINKY